MSVDESELRDGVAANAARIEASAARVRGMPSGALDERGAREAVRDDLGALQAIPQGSPEWLRATEAIGQNVGAQSSYAAEFAKEVQRARDSERRQEQARAAPSAAAPSALQEAQRPEPAIGNTIERGPERESARTAPETIVLDGATQERLAARRARDRESLAIGNANAGPGADATINERFISALDRRLEKCELEERGWKGRDDLVDVVRDLEKLAAVDFGRASDLWSRYRPDDRDKPPFLDNDEYADQRRKARAAGPPERDEDKEFVAPEQVRKRFIQADNRYYFRHDDNKLAFEDHGRRLATQHDDPVVALSMVQMAEAKGWQTITLRGTDEFKRTAWLQASAKGIEVHGYKPRDVDLEKLAELQKELGPRADQSRNIKTPAAEGRTAATAAHSAAREPLEREAVVDETRRSLRPSEQVIVEVLERSARKAGVPEATVTRLADYASRRYQNTRVVVGRLGEHGYAPYENDPKNESSYYLRVSTDKGDRTLWGVDLARAIKESGTKDGDEIVVVNRGRQPVAVQVKERDEAGKVVGTKTVSTHRNVWEVTELQAFRANVQEKFKQAAEKEAPPVNVLDRDAPRTVPRPEVVIQRTPDLERSR